MEPSYIAVIVSIFAALIACFSWSVNRDKLRLDLYNKRFDIYSKTVDLYLNLPSNAKYDTLDDEGKKEFDNYVSLKQDFTKYHRESKFLFSEELGIFEKIEGILVKINGILGFARTQETPVTKFTIQRSEQVLNDRLSLEDDLSNLEDLIGEYLKFPGYKPIKLENILKRKETKNS